KAATEPLSPHTPFTVLPPPITPMQRQLGARDSAHAAKAKADKETAAGSAIPADIKVKNPKGNRELLLFIEDEVEVAEVAADMLADEGYKVIEVHDGFEALKIYERIGKKIGLVIL